MKNEPEYLNKVQKEQLHHERLQKINQKKIEMTIRIPETVRIKDAPINQKTV